MYSVLSMKTCGRLLKCVYYGPNRKQTAYAYEKLCTASLQPSNDILLGRPVSWVLRMHGSSLLVKDDMLELFGRGTIHGADDGQLEIEF